MTLAIAERVQSGPSNSEEVLRRDDITRVQELISAAAVYSAIRDRDLADWPAKVENVLPGDKEQALGARVLALAETYSPEKMRQDGAEQLATFAERFHGLQPDVKSTLLNYGMHGVLSPEGKWIPGISQATKGEVTLCRGELSVELPALAPRHKVYEVLSVPQSNLDTRPDLPLPEYVAPTTFLGIQGTMPPNGLEVSQIPPPPEATWPQRPEGERPARQDNETPWHRPDLAAVPPVRPNHSKGIQIGVAPTSEAQMQEILYFAMDKVMPGQEIRGKSKRAVFKQAWNCLKKLSKEPPTYKGSGAVYHQVWAAFEAIRNPVNLGSRSPWGRRRELRQMVRRAVEGDAPDIKSMIKDGHGGRKRHRIPIPRIPAPRMPIDCGIVRQADGKYAV